MVRVPLKVVRIPGVAAVGRKALLTVLVLSRLRTWEALEFIVDTGATVSTIPVSTAIEKRLVVPEGGVEIGVWTAAGRVRQRRRPSQLTFRIPGLDPRQFVWPCHFVEHVGQPPKPCLALAGVLDDLRLTFEGTYRDDAPYGSLLIEPVASRRR